MTCDYPCSSCCCCSTYAALLRGAVRCATLAVARAPLAPRTRERTRVNSLTHIRRLAYLLACGLHNCFCCEAPAGALIPFGLACSSLFFFLLPKGPGQPAGREMVRAGEALSWAKAPPPSRPPIWRSKMLRCCCRGCVRLRVPVRAGVCGCRWAGGKQSCGSKAEQGIGNRSAQDGREGLSWTA